MTLVARASKTVRLKNLIILAMCVVFCGLFVRDGFYAYPTNNNVKVFTILRDHGKELSPEHALLMEDFLKQGGWDKASDETREKIDAAIKEEAVHVGTEGWKGPFDVKLQRGLAIGLVGCVAGALWWVIHCQRRRVIAEDGTVSPGPGVVVPWEKITRVDNTRWKTVGIVEMTYTDEAGQTQKAEFDDYKVQRVPLLAILDLLSEKAVNAEFLPKEEAAVEGEKGKEAGGETKPTETPPGA